MKFQKRCKKNRVHSFNETENTRRSTRPPPNRFSPKLAFKPGVPELFACEHPHLALFGFSNGYPGGGACDLRVRGSK